MKKNNSITRSKNKLGFIDPNVAGIDIGAAEIYVSIPNGSGGTEVRKYKTTTPQLHQIAKDLKLAGVTTGVMEATGVYWIPLYEVLESEEYNLNPVLVDAKSVKNVPGRKTDVIDCQWIQTLFSNGLLRAAFRPPKDRLTLREYVRLRKSISKNRQRALLHIEKALQLMNIKLSSALSDIGSVSGLTIVRAIVRGERDPEHLASLRHRSCKKPKREFVDALTGNYRDEHLFALEIALSQYDYSYEQMKQCDERILGELEKLPTITEAPLPPRDKEKKWGKLYSKARKADKNMCTFDVRTLLWKKSGIDLGSLPGLSDLSSLVIFAELGGTDVNAWASQKEFCSWLKLCPGNNISGGKARKSKHKPSLNPISQTLRMGALACKNAKNGLGAFIRRICGRTDKLKGVKAGAHRIGGILYQMCKHGMAYVERGEEYMNKVYEERILKNLRKQAKGFGFDLVSIG